MSPYPVLLYLGITIGLYGTLLAARAEPLSTGRVLTAMLVLIVVALLGARLLYVAPRWRAYRADPWRVLRFRDGGASMFGGLLLAGPLSLVVVPALDLPVARFWDLATFTMVPGLVVTRVGCLLHGCCSGRETSGYLGLWLTDDGGVRARRVPLQAIDATCGLVILAVVGVLWRRDAPDGVVVLAAIALYCGARAVLEPLRAHRDHVHGMSLTRLITVPLCVACVAMLVSVRWP